METGDVSVFKEETMELREIICNLLELNLSTKVKVVEGCLNIADLFDVPKQAKADKLDMSIRDYKALLDRKDNLSELTKENNAAKEQLEQEICKMMVDEEKPSTVVDGFTYSLQQSTQYSKRSQEYLSEQNIDFFDVLREQGLGDLIVERVDPRTLNSSCKALVEEQGELPEELAECLSIYEKLTLSKRKANTKALERAKANREE